MSKTIFFSVGEPSGDQHAARLIQALCDSDPAIQVRGFGGSAMRDVGCQIDLELTSHAVVGILEVLPKLRDFFRFADDAEKIFAQGEVDAVILVDFPGFNWHIAKRAKKYGIPVFYYCPPQLWAWGAWRVKKMKATVDHVLAVLPIEESFFSGHGIPTTFVGHPFFDATRESRLNADLIQQIDAAAGSGVTVGILPGSRTHEVQRNWPLMLQAAGQLCVRHPDVRFAVACYREKHLDYCRETLDGADPSLPIDLYLGATSEIIDRSACAMMVSGSVSLELMARRTPAAVVYRVGRFLYGVAKCVVKIDSMTLPNLMQCEQARSTGTQVPNGDQRVFPEHVSVGRPDAAIDFLSSCIDRMLSDPKDLNARLEQLDQLNAQYAKAGASERAAHKILQLIRTTSKTSSENDLSGRKTGVVSEDDSRRCA